MISQPKPNMFHPTPTFSLSVVLHYVIKSIFQQPRNGQGEDVDVVPHGAGRQGSLQVLDDTGFRK